MRKLMPLPGLVGAILLVIKVNNIISKQIDRKNFKTNVAEITKRSNICGFHYIFK